MGKLWEELPLSRVVKTSLGKPPGGTCKAQMGRAIRPTPTGRTIRTTPHPSGLFARKWGSFSLFPDSAITHQNFLTPNTPRADCLHTTRLSKARAWWLGTLRHSARWGVAVGCPCAQVSSVWVLGGNTGKGEAVLRTMTRRSHRNVGQRFTLLSRPILLPGTVSGD